MAGLYDLMILLDPDAAEERHLEILEYVRGAVAESGTIVEEQDWGRRRIAFEIDHRPEANYHLLQFEGEAELLDRLRHQLKITDGVLRHRIIRLKPGQPTPEPPAQRSERDGRREEGGDTQVAPRAAADA